MQQLKSKQKLELEHTIVSFPGAGGAPKEPSILVRLLDIFIVMCVALSLCLYDTGKGSFGDGDQTTHSIVVQNMIHSGDFLHPRLPSIPYYSKPPFKMWLATIPVMLMGESNYSYRVIDGLAGMGVVLCVFFFAQALFASRLIAYLSAFAMLGSRLFFFGHGVRNATQDVMMVLLLSIGTVIGWYIIELARQPSSVKLPLKRLFTLSIAGGLAVGCAVLTKNVPGYFPFVIVGLHVLFTREVWPVLKRGGLFLLIAVAISICIPLAYIESQGRLTPMAWQGLFTTEVYNRATVGYHFVTHHWIYWNNIVHNRTLVPPELLFAGILFAAYQGFKLHDRRAVFLLTWAIAPVIIQNLAKSKLAWYILPALPAMAILVGIVSGEAISRAAEYWSKREPANWKPRYGYLFLSLYAVGALSVAFGVMAYDIWRPWKRNITDEMVQDIRQFAAETGTPLRSVFFNCPEPLLHERFYWSMMPIQKMADDDYATLRRNLESNQPMLIITSIPESEKIEKIKPSLSYALIPPRAFRTTWLAVLNYVPGLTPRHFVSVEQRIPLAEHSDVLNYGFKPVERLNDLLIRPSAGSRSSFLLDSNRSYLHFGTDLTINIASTLPAKNGTIDAQVYLNEERIGAIKNIQEGFHLRSIYIPASKWRQKKNLLTLVYELPDGGKIAPDRQIVLMESISLKGHPSGE